MRHTPFRLTALTVLVALSVVPRAAGSMAVGLRSDGGVHVQEYAADGQLQHCIHNARADTVALVLREYWREDYHEDLGDGSAVYVSGGRAVTGDTLAVLALAPGEFTHLPALEVQHPRLVQFIANGEPIGVVPNYCPPPVETGLPVVMWANLDCPGWHSDGFWTEQSSLWVRSGDEFTVDLVLEKDAGILRIDRVPGRIPEDLPEDRLLVPYDVVSSSLVIAKSPEDFTISASAPAVSEGTHRATLRFRAPEVQSRALFLFGGFRWIEYGTEGHPVRRAVLVEPQGANSLPPN